MTLFLYPSLPLMTLMMYLRFTALLLYCFLLYYAVFITALASVRASVSTLQFLIRHGRWVWYQVGAGTKVNTPVAWEHNPRRGAIVHRLSFECRLSVLLFYGIRYNKSMQHRRI